MIITKKSTLIFTFLWTLGLVLLFVFADSCYDNVQCKNVMDFLELIQGAVFFPIVLFFLSLATYFMPQSIFDRWKRFALWSVPLITVLGVWLGNIDTGGDIGGAIRDGFINIALGIIYAWFFLHSLALIIITYRRERRLKQ